MSRSFRKNYKIGGEGNIPYYKMRRKLRRRRMNHELRNLFANYLPKEVDERIVGDVMPKEDQWSEPSDGHGGLSKADYKAHKELYSSRFYKKIRYVFKNEREKASTPKKRLLRQRSSQMTK